MSNPNVSLLLIVVQGSLIIIIAMGYAEQAVLALFISSIAGLWFHRKSLAKIVRDFSDK